MFKLAYFHSDLYIVLLFIFFLFLSSCGGGSPVVSVEESREFREWKSKIPQNASEFVSWWNSTEKNTGWKFSYYGENGITYPDRSTPEEVWQTKIINCNRFVILFQPILGGRARVYPQEGRPYSHVTLLLDSGEELSLSGLTVSILKGE